MEFVRLKSRLKIKGLAFLFLLNTLIEPLVYPQITVSSKVFISRDSPIQKSLSLLNLKTVFKKLNISKIDLDSYLKKDVSRTRKIATFIVEGRQYFRKKEWLSSLLNFRKVLELSPNNSTASRFIRRILQELPQIKKEDIEEFNNIQQELKDNIYKDILEEESREALSRGIKKFNQGRFDKALVNFEEVIAFRPRSRTARRYFRKAQKRLRVKIKELKEIEARMYAEEIARKRDFSLRLEEEKAKLLSFNEAKRREEELSRIYAQREERIRESRKKREAYSEYSAGLVFLNNNQYAQAIERFRKVLQIIPGYKPAQEALNLSQQALRAKRVLSEEERAVLLASAYEEEKKSKEYFLEEEKALEYAGEVARIRETELSRKELEALMLAKEEEELRLSRLATRKEKVVSLIEKAKLLYTKKQWKKAQEKFKEVLKLEPLNQEASYYLRLTQAKILKEEERAKKNKLFPTEKELPEVPYIVDIDDVVRITVLFHEEFSGDVVVGPDGTITLPLAGVDVEAAGLTEKQLAEAVARKLKRFVEAPEVFVKVTQFNSKKVYVLGEIANPGVYRLKNRKLTIRDLMFIAGLPKRGTSAIRRVLVIRQTPEGPVKRYINVYNILYNGDLRDNIVLSNGDIVYVPMAKHAKIAEVVQQITAPMDALVDFNDARADLEAIINEFREKVMKKPSF